MSRISRLGCALAAVYLGLSLVVIRHHAREINFNRPVGTWRMERHLLVLAGDGVPPWTYRVLVPAMAEALHQPLGAITGSSRLALEYAYVILRVVFTLALLVLFDRYLRTWLDPPWAMAGTVFVAAITPFSFIGGWFHLNLTVDFTLWVACALLTLAGRDRWLYPLIFIGALNRQTSLFVVAMHAALRMGKEPLPDLVKRCVVLGLVWLVPTVALRMVMGIEGWAVPVQEIAVRNFHHPTWWAWVAVFLGAFWVLPWIGFTRRPAELRWLALFLTPYLLIQFVFGRIIETRLFLPMAIVLVPLGLLMLRELAASESAGARGS